MHVCACAHGWETSTLLGFRGFGAVVRLCRAGRNAAWRRGLEPAAAWPCLATDRAARRWPACRPHQLDLLPWQVLEAALDLLLLLAAADEAALASCCRLGFIPAVLRFALPSTPIDLRLQVWAAASAGGWAEALAAHGPVAPPHQLPQTRTALTLQQVHEPRPAAAGFAEILCRSSLTSAQQVVACQGVPFIR